MAAGAGLGAAIGLGTAIYGGIAAGKVRKGIERQMANRPGLSTPAALSKMVATAESREGMGISDAAKNLAQTSAAQGMSTGVSALTKAGRGALASGVTSLVRGQQDAANQMALQDEAARQRNLGAAQQARGMMAQNQTAIQRDRQDAYQEKLSFMNQRYNQMQGLASQGLGIAASSAAKMEKNPFSGLFKKPEVNVGDFIKKVQNTAGPINTINPLLIPRNQ
jgi:hypothetical protein